jgi:2-polyprenyl-6-methoxyphenol hydroxylase-like FAD-dependent oxidoreductase
MITNWHPRLRSLFEAADPSSLAVFPFYAAHPAPTWPSHNVTVLGDAVHVMPPTGGVGGSTAIRDAHLLAEHINMAAAGHTSLPLAVHDYEAAMLRDGFVAVRRSLRPVTAQKLFSRPLMFHLATKLVPPVAERVLALTRVYQRSHRRTAVPPGWPPRSSPFPPAVGPPQPQDP